MYPGTFAATTPDQAVVDMSDTGAASAPADEPPRTGTGPRHRVRDTHLAKAV